MNLRDAIGKDVYIMENEQYTDTDLQIMSTEELERLKMRINLKINSLSSAIKAKQIDHSKGGEGATKEWYINHRYALTINQRVLPYINSLIKQRRRRLSDHFMDQARKLLPQDEFEMILKNAQIKMEGNQ